MAVPAASPDPEGSSAAGPAISVRSGGSQEHCVRGRKHYTGVTRPRPGRSPRRPARTAIRGAGRPADRLLLGESWWALPARRQAGTRVRASTDQWGPPPWMEVQMNIIAWLVLGAIAGYLAGFLVKGDEGLGVIGHIVLGIVGALVGGFLASVLFKTNPIDGPFDISSIVTAVIGAIIVVVVVNAVTGRSRSGRGAI